ncbi:hypothetical protein CDIK_1635 [Cucumispora dikerogammari]|nr:hypothetical protein CDIK_1635 [Cucumispora dikerogammari]
MLERSSLTPYEQTRLDKVINLFEQKLYHEAYLILKEFKDSEINIILVLQTFCLIKLESYKTAYKQSKQLKYEKDLQGFLTPIYTLFNKPDDFIIYFSTNIYQRYLYSLFKNDYEFMLTTSFNKYEGIELFTYIFMMFNNQKTAEPLLIGELKRLKSFDFSLFYLLLSNSFCVEVIFEILKSTFLIKDKEIQFKSGTTVKIVSDRFYIISIIYLFLIKQYDVTLIVNNNILEIIDFLHISLPNTGLYQFIEQKLKILGVKATKTKLRFVEILKEYKNKTRLNEAPIYEIELNTNLRSLEIDFFRRKNILALIILYKEKKLKNIKLLLSALIGSKKLENIIIALFISYKNYDSGNYEFQIIYAFILRLLCNLFHLETEYKRINPGEVQIMSLAFILSDLAILKKTKQSEIFTCLFSSVFNVAYKIKQKALESLLTYIINKKYLQAISLIKVIRQINESELLIEVENWKILAKNSTSSFLNLLGEECSYLFRKVTVYREEIDLDFFNIFTLSGKKFSCNLFKDNYSLGICKDDAFFEILSKIEKEQKQFIL